jgi:hypothetical protein
MVTPAGIRARSTAALCPQSSQKAKKLNLSAGKSSGTFSTSSIDGILESQA